LGTTDGVEATQINTKMQLTFIEAGPAPIDFGNYWNACGAMRVMLEKF
jgi:hypothetical protein